MAAFESFIADKTYVEGAYPSAGDAAVFAHMGQRPDPSAFPHSARFYNHIASMSAVEISRLPPSQHIDPAQFFSSLTSGSSAERAAVSTQGHSSGPAAMKIGDAEFEAGVARNNHPVWYRPRNGVYSGLNVHNTLTESSKRPDLDPFIPANGRRVLWYTCGPTVYDSCHMGHARAYLTFDILRRIVEDYFGYEVLYHVNITDIDDKIILRARRNHLITTFLSELTGDEKAKFKAISAQIEQQIAEKRAKMDKKQIELSVDLPSSAGSREKEELETKRKEHALKANQFAVTCERVALVNSVHTGGMAAAVESLVARAKALTPPVMASTLEELKAALTGRTVEIQDKLETLRDAEKPSTAEIASMEQALSGVDSVSMCVDSAITAQTSSPSEALVGAAKDELGERLDAEKGDAVTDQKIFNAHARKFEREFMEDMAVLNVREPDVLTRVTEYVPQIIEFIEKIIANGFAYETAGNVYLDTEAFKAKGHSYRKLHPFHGETSEDAMAESEGALGAAGVKRTKNDFALWKASKRGEPSWSSPWGMGRPGWHIECSVVAGDILGENIDVHAGGVDLKFPHHDNELAQSEACYGHHQWVNYFFHAGHLHIKGLKMSKSLKNFITIRQALVEHSPRQLRLMFLLQPWDKPMNYSDQTVDDAKKKESLFKNYFGTVKSILRTDWLASAVGWQRGDEDRALIELGLDVQSRVHAALCDNFNTPATLLALCDLVTATNKYLEKSTPHCVSTLRKHAVYITRILRVLGVVEGNDEIGFPAGGGGADKEATIAPFIDTLVEFRDSVRAAALESKDSKVLQACDAVRDEQMVALGVRIEDKTDGSLWKLDDPAVLRQEIEEKQRKQTEAALKKREGLIKKKADELAKAKESAVAPSQLYAHRTEEFSKFDDSGLPTHDSTGAEISKAAAKKLSKVLDKQRKAHEQLCEKAGGIEQLADYLQRLEAELTALQTS